jgi:hypothetical protein
LGGCLIIKLATHYTLFPSPFLQQASRRIQKSSGGTIGRETERVDDEPANCCSNTD